MSQSCRIIINAYLNSTSLHNPVDLTQGYKNKQKKQVSNKMVALHLTVKGSSWVRDPAIRGLTRRSRTC